MADERRARRRIRSPLDLPWQMLRGGLARAALRLKNGRASEIEAAYLGHLLRHLPGKLLVVWDGLPQHRARLSRSLSARSRAGWRSSACPPTRRNSTRWNTSGATGNITSCPTSARAISASSAIRRAAHCGACAVARAWCVRSGGKLICHYDMQVSIGFGGDDWTTLFITTYTELGRVQMEIPGLAVPRGEV